MYILYICILAPFIQTGFSLIGEETDLNSLSSYEATDDNENFQVWSSEADAGTILFDSFSKKEVEEICKDSNTLVYVRQEDVTIDCGAFKSGDKPLDTETRKVKRDAGEGSGAQDVVDGNIDATTQKSEESSAEAVTIQEDNLETVPQNDTDINEPSQDLATETPEESKTTETVQDTQDLATETPEESKTTLEGTIQEIVPQNETDINESSVKTVQDLAAETPEESNTTLIEESAAKEDNESASTENENQANVAVNIPVDANLNPESPEEAANVDDTTTISSTETETSLKQNENQTDVPANIPDATETTQETTQKKADDVGTTVSSTETESATAEDGNRINVAFNIPDDTNRNQEAPQETVDEVDTGNTKSNADVNESNEKPIKQEHLHPIIDELPKEVEIVPDMGDKADTNVHKTGRGMIIPHSGQESEKQEHNANSGGDESVKTEESSQDTTKKAGSKDTTILVTLFVAVVVVGALAFGYNFIKKRKQQSADLERVERGSIKRSLQNLARADSEPEKKPLMGDGKEVEMVDMKKSSSSLDATSERTPNESTVKT